MTTIHFVKNGLQAGKSITESHEGVAMNLITRNFAFGLGNTVVYSATAPSINPGVVATDHADFGHVVIQVDEIETNEEFPKAGFYYVRTLTVKAARDTLGLPAASV